MSIFNESPRLIKESVDSIVNQSFLDFECIIVVDNPQRTDVDRIIRDYNDSRLKVFKNKKNIGLALSMNYAASLASSDIFARMDADDIADLSRLELEYDIITHQNVDVVFSNHTCIDMESKDIFNRNHDNANAGLVKSKEIALKPSMVHHPTVMMKRKVFERVGGYRDFPCAQDFDLWMRMQENGASFFRIGQSLLKYRINPGSTTRTKYFKQQLTMHYIYSLSTGTTAKTCACKENYEAYIQYRGVSSKPKERRFLKALFLLKKAKRGGHVRRLLYRFLAYTISPRHREFYMMTRRKEKMLDENISNNSKL